MKQTIKLRESELKRVIVESVRRVLKEERDEYDHTKMEWLKGKLDDIRHQFAVVFGHEPSDLMYMTIIGGLGKQYKTFKDPALLDKMKSLKAKYGPGYERRNYGKYRDNEEEEA